MIALLSFFWYVRTARQLAFALYLWQLKEYHIKRFLDYFTTSKGKRVLFHPFLFIKVFLFVLWFFSPSIAFVLLLGFYIGEAVLSFRALRRGKLLLPVFTKKTTVLLASLQFVQVSFLFFSFAVFPLYIVPLLLLFDVFSLAISSVVVLLWQPYTVFMRSRILRRAIAKRKEMKALRVVGITGSYGKTSTKEMLAHILSSRFVVLKTPEHRNSEVGIAQTILYDLTDEHEVFVCEMGAYSKGGIKLLSDIAQPDIGIVTGANSQHLSLFGSKKNLLSAEGGGELAQALPLKAPLIANYDSPVLREHAKTFENVVWCSVKERQDVWARDVVAGKDILQFTLMTKDGEEKVESRLAGAWNAENMVLAAATALELGMSLKEVAQGLSSLPVEVGSLQIKKGKGFAILDSSYSANPDGVIAALEHLKLWEKRKIVVMPPLIELGFEAEAVHERIGEKIAEVCDFAIMTGRDYVPQILKGAEKGKMEEGSIFFLEDPKEITDKMFRMLQEGDAVLLEGRIPSGVLSLLQS